MASPELINLIAMRRANPYLPQKSVAQLRQETEERAESPPEGVSITPDSFAGVSCAWVVAKEAQNSEAVCLWFHGGGYYRGSVQADRSVTAHLSRISRMRVLSVDYRLAPEHPFPAAIEDAHLVYRSLLKRCPAQRIAVGGISAGGGVSLALLLAAREAGDALPAAAIPMSPWTDLLQTGETYTSRAADDPTISKEYLDRWAEAYLAGADGRNPLASPLYGDLQGLPPLLIQVGQPEVMFDDSARFTEKAQAAGSLVTLRVWPDVVHGWQSSSSVPEAQQSLQEAALFLAQHVQGLPSQA